jgi:hypothetical protein
MALSEARARRADVRAVIRRWLTPTPSAGLSISAKVLERARWRAVNINDANIVTADRPYNNASRPRPRSGLVATAAVVARTLGD